MLKDFQHKLNQIVVDKKAWTKRGQVASYIPELKKADPNILGAALVDLEGNLITSGDIDYEFTIQSISKIITLAIALMEEGEEKVFSVVGKEPTGDPFNSIIKLETLQPARPLNPMINAGAIAISSLIRGKNVEERFKKITDLIYRMTGKEKILYCEKVYLSEKRTGHRNRALTYFMLNDGVIQGEVEEILDLYFRQCAILLTVSDLARIGAVFANEGRSLDTGEELINPRVARIIKTFMVTCGMYNSSGEFAIDVGIPAKSGVGGGIVAAVPGKVGIGVAGPALDEKGNSIAGIKVLEEVSKELGLSMF
ncbi:MAG: glutaminase A [Halanaerobiales bacterium]|nr:glutaminase A [Halanaerobiales bacterium]